MKHVLIALGAFALSAPSAIAGGLERSAQSVSILFEPGTYAEFSIGAVDPEVTGVGNGPFAGLPSGDMAGGYNPVKDLYKTRVFESCRWRNANHRAWMKGPAGEVIPPRVIDKPPTAELRANQKDEDSLPPYPVLDAILERLIEGDASVAEIVAEGFDRETVKKVERLIYLSEYKRFQSAPGTRLTRHAFWLDRRYPIVNRWRDPN